MPTLQTQQQIWKRVEKIEAGVMRDITANYRKALEAIRADIALAFERYAVEGSLTFSEMQKFNRMVKLNASITKSLNAMGAANNRIVQSWQNGAYTQNYYGYSWGTDNQFNVALNWDQFNFATVRAAVDNPMYHLARRVR